MILKIYNGEYSLQWDGIYYLALIDYPNIQEWELEKIAKFIAYEKLHKRQTSIECANSCLKKEILDYIDENSAEEMINQTKANIKDLTIRFLTNIKYNKRG